ncbi:MAG TPA: WecB/TagA/CpsF family glycosyltransferase [Puia sp.]|nr:WecB/TagA/CpsF family glycosyltransferase [Puia sp.]
MQRDQLIHFDISIGSYPSFIDNIISLAKQKSSSYVCVANVHMFVEAYLDKNFNQVIEQADIVTPDGKPLTWGLRMLKGIKQDRVAGSDILPDLIKESERLGLSVFFYGGSQKMLDDTSEFLKTNHTNLKVAGLYSPPFRKLSDDENNKMVSMINDSGADIVMVVLGCPKQEKWMASMKGKINAVMIGVGGALPLFIGAQKRAPNWMQKIGLEWLFRLAIEPRRLFKRYASTNPYFIYIVFKEFFRLRVLRKAS